MDDLAMLLMAILVTVALLWIQRLRRSLKGARRALQLQEKYLQHMDRREQELFQQVWVTQKQAEDAERERKAEIDRQQHILLACKDGFQKVEQQLRSERDALAARLASNNRITLKSKIEDNAGFASNVPVPDPADPRVRTLEAYLEQANREISMHREKVRSRFAPSIMF